MIIKIVLVILSTVFAATRKRNQQIIETYDRDNRKNEQVKSRKRVGNTIITEFVVKPQNKKCKNSFMQQPYNDEFDSYELDGLQDKDSIEKVELKIRKKGTFTLGQINLEDNLAADPNSQWYQPVNQLKYFTPQQLLMLANQRKLKHHKQSVNNKYHDKYHKQSDNNKHHKQFKKQSIDDDDGGGVSYNSILTESEKKRLNLFFHSRIELPLFCKFSLSKNQQVQLANQSQQLLDCWLQSNDLKLNLTYIQLPYLCADEFTNFYRCVHKAMEKPMKVDEEWLNKIENQQQLMNGVQFGDIEREQICWLEFWVYMCNDGQQPPIYKYMANLTQQEQMALQQMVNYVDKNAQTIIPLNQKLDDDKLKQKYFIQQANYTVTTRKADPVNDHSSNRLSKNRRRKLSNTKNRGHKRFRKRSVQQWIVDNLDQLIT